MTAVVYQSHRAVQTHSRPHLGVHRLDSALRNSSGVGKGIYKSVVQSDREFLNVGVSDRQ